LFEACSAKLLPLVVIAVLASNFQTIMPI